jgi:hypothetical protein
MTSSMTAWWCDMKVCPYCGSTDYCVHHDPFTMNNDYECRVCHNTFYDPIAYADYKNLVQKNPESHAWIVTAGEHYATKLREAADKLQYCAYDSHSQNFAYHLKQICDIVAEYMECKG